MSYNIRNKEGYLTAVVSPMIARRLQRTYMGRWTTRDGDSIWEFKESAVFGDGEIGLAIFPGSYIEMD